MSLVAVLPYLLPDEYIDSDSPAVMAVAHQITTSLPSADRTNAYTVSYAVYKWVVQNVEFDAIYDSTNYTDTTSGKW